MQMLIVGIGALGGTIAPRAIRAGLPVRLAARSTDSAEALRRSGLRVSGIGGEVRADAIDVAAIEDYGKGDQFDLILLATKAQDALEVAPHVVGLLPPDGVIFLYRMAELPGHSRIVWAKIRSLVEFQILVPRW